MKVLLTMFLISTVAFLIGCEPSGTAKQEMEKFSGTPTPTLKPIPTEVPIDPADIVQVDTNLDGDNLSVNADQQTKTVDCTKFNNVMVNGDDHVATLRGVCRKVTINGDGNTITVNAAMEFVFNGTGNTVTYTRFPNGKRPLVTQNSPGNTVEKVAAIPAKKK